MLPTGNDMYNCTQYPVSTIVEILTTASDVWPQPLANSSCMLDSGNVVAQGLAVSLDKPLEWAIGFFFGNTELSLELWNIIAGISGFDD